MIIPIPKEGLISFPAIFCFKGNALEFENVILDTGANNILLDADKASIFGLTDQDVTEQGRTNTGAGLVYSKRYTFDYVEALNYKSSAIKVTCYPFVGKVKGYDAIIGLSFLKVVLAHLGLDFLKEELYTL
jgi:hypothetical protein